MIGWISTLRRGDASPELAARALDGLERSARQQWRLINELLDIARIEQGKLQLDMARVDLADIVSAAVEAARPMSAAAGVELTFPPVAVLISADAARLQQVVTNLINNAIQHTHEGGRVVVTVEDNDKEVWLRVSDNGAGVSADILPHVFEMFRQGDTLLSRRHGGLGLGLAITKGIVEAHGGRVMAESDGLGLGATFTVILPR
jgi:signal transduction histidine kinase